LWPPLATILRGVVAAIVSREEELASFHAFIGEERGGGPIALVLEGEAGIRKSTLWLPPSSTGARTGCGSSRRGPELAEQAMRLTPPDDPEARDRRALRAARAHLAAGEWTRTRTIATELPGPSANCGF
jgi:hypothetical protein